jgi:hypothetical protein
MRNKNAIKLWALLAVFSGPCLSSDYEFGFTNNAVVGSGTWGMSSPLFPMAAIPGVDINGVFYRYTAVKDPNDPYTVSIQNEAADGSGYIFRETDDWSGGSGGTIQKFIPLRYSPLGNWGEGSIDEVGLGSVTDPTVIYSYRIDPDRIQPQIDVELPAVEVYDALNDGYVTANLEPTDRDLYDRDLEEKRQDEDEEDDGRMEKALAASSNALTVANAVSQDAMILAMNITQLNQYYAARIPGRVYQETVVLKDKKLPDNKRGARVGLAQQLLHEKMVLQQWR